MSNSQTKNFNSVPNPSCSNYLNILTCQRLFPIWPCHENLLRLHTEKIANVILSKQLNLNHHILCNIQLYLLHVGNHNTKTNIWYSMHNKCILCVIHNYCISSMWATIMLGCASLHPTTLHQYHQSYNLKVLFTYTNQHLTAILVPRVLLCHDKPLLHQCYSTRTHHYIYHTTSDPNAVIALWCDICIYHICPQCGLNTISNLTLMKCLNQDLIFIYVSIPCWWRSVS